MKKRNRWFVGLATAIAGACLFFATGSVHGAEIDLNGTSAKDAVVKTSSGENVTGKNDLSRWEVYNVSYDWSVPKGVTPKKGDTATFQLPNNIQIIDDTKFPIKDANKNVVGEFVIKSGAKEGTLTFNDYYATHPTNNIHGTLWFTGAGTKDESVQNWDVNKASWLSSNGTPTWSIAYNPQKKHLTNVNFVDTLGKGQTFTGDIIVQYGTYVPNGQFKVEKEEVNPSNVKVKGNQLFVHFDSLDTTVQIVYTTKPINQNEQDKLLLTNKVVVTSDQIKNAEDSAKIVVLGGGSVEGTTPKPNKPSDKPTQKPSKEPSKKPSQKPVKKPTPRPVKKHHGPVIGNCDTHIYHEEGCRHYNNMKDSQFRKDFKTEADAIKAGYRECKDGDLKDGDLNGGSSEKVASPSVDQTPVSAKFVRNTPKEEKNPEPLEAKPLNDTLPQTGSSSDKVLSMVGCGLILISMSAWVWFKHHREQSTK